MTGMFPYYLSEEENTIYKKMTDIQLDRSFLIL